MFQSGTGGLSTTITKRVSTENRWLPVCLVIRTLMLGLGTGVGTEDPLRIFKVMNLSV